MGPIASLAACEATNRL